MPVRIGADSEWVHTAVPLALAPRASDPTRQRFVSADVAVRERSQPEYALVLEAECVPPGAQGPVRSALELSKPQLARVFEMALVNGTSGTAGAFTDALGGSVQRENAVLDAAVRVWLRGGGKVPPPRRKELVKWLLARTFLAHSDMACGSLRDQWTLAVGVDATEEAEQVRADEGWPDYAAPPAGGEGTGDARDGYTRDGAATAAAASEPAYQIDEDLPGYEAVSFAPASPRIQRCSAGNGQASAIEEEERGAKVSDPFAHDSADEDRDAWPSIDEVDAPRSLITRQGREAHVQDGEYWEGVDQSRPFSAPERPAEDACVEPSSEREERLRIPSPSSTPAFFKREPATRRLGTNLELEPNEWTEDRRRFAVELSASKRDVEKAKREKEKAERVAELRTTQLLARGRRQLERSQRRRRDAERVRTLIADTLECHSILLDVDTKVKQTKIAAQREQERLTQCMRVAIGRTDKWKKGAVIGPGPLSQREMDLRWSEPVAPVRTVYDLHGRRHSVSEAGKVAVTSDLESAKGKIQRSLLGSGKALELFRLYDRDATRALSYAKFLRLMREQCSTTLTDEQSEALFRHFDPNQSGEIDYGELLWGFFNHQAFLKRWAHKRRGRSDRETRMLFYRYDRAGRGALSSIDFLLALEDLGFRVNDDDAKMLCMRFDSNGDGFVDYSEFCAFVGGAESDRDAKSAAGEEYGSLPRQSRRRSLTVPRSTDDKKIVKLRGTTATDGGMESILAELHELQTTQTRIRQHLT